MEQDRFSRLSQTETSMCRNLLSRKRLRFFLRTSIAFAGLAWLLSAILVKDGPRASISEIDSSIRGQLQQVLKQAASRSMPNPGAALLAFTSLEAKNERGEPFIALVAGPNSRTDDAPLLPHTPFGVASITKMMVAALTFIYAERGLLDIDTPILRLVDDDSWLLDHVSNSKFRRALGSLTLRNLLAHRSGLADYWEDEQFSETWRYAKNKQWRPTELMNWAGQQDPVCEPNSCFQYSDTNYVIVGLALEELTGRRLNEQLRTEIFVPLQMRCSWMFFEEKAPRGCAAPTHSYEAGLDVTSNKMQSADWAGGGVYSTLEDQLKLLRGLFGGRLISKKSLAEMQRWGESDLGEKIVYGLGLYKTNAGSGMTLIGHTGVHNAFSFLWVEAGILMTGSLNQSANEVLRDLVFPVVRLIHKGSGRIVPQH